MSLDEKSRKEPQTSTGSEMIAAMTEGVLDALSEHKRSGRSVIVWDRETDQISEVSAKDIPAREIIQTL